MRAMMSMPLTFTKFTMTTIAMTRSISTVIMLVVILTACLRRADVERGLSLLRAAR